MSLSNYSVDEIFGDAGFRPGSRGPFVSAKGPKTIDAQFGLIGWDGRKMRRADQLAALRQGPPNSESVRPEGRTAGVGYWEEWMGLMGATINGEWARRKPQEIPPKSRSEGGEKYINSNHCPNDIYRDSSIQPVHSPPPCLG